MVEDGGRLCRRCTETLVLNRTDFLFFGAVEGRLLLVRDRCSWFIASAFASRFFGAALAEMAPSLMQLLLVLLLSLLLFIMRGDENVFGNKKVDCKNEVSSETAGAP